MVDYLAFPPHPIHKANAIQLWISDGFGFNFIGRNFCV
jgi:hypothetical protein